VYKDQLKLKGESKVEEKDQSCVGVRKSKNKVSQEKRKLDSTKIEINKDSTKREEKKREEKKGRVRKKKSVEKIKKHVDFYAKMSEIKNAYFSDMPMIILLYKDVYFNTNDLDCCLPSIFVSLLQGFKNIFPNKIYNRLEPIRGIEHQINLVPITFIFNWPVHRSNP